jgi:5-methylcytosine-specific restriction endonuclease McrA
MVMLLPRPEVDSVTLLDEVIEERQNGINARYFNGIAAEWRQRVRDYERFSGSPEHVPRWAAIEARRNTFLNLYASSEGSAQGDVIARMRDEHELLNCPACGELGSPYTLDHYLPKGLYPHFCITPLNLFPMCDACQARKGSKTGDANSPRFFIHPYFDVFVGEQVLELTFLPPFDKPGFSLGCRAGLSADQARLVQSHIRELELEKRYRRYFKGQHRRLLKLVSKLKKSDQDVLVSLEGFRDSCAVSGANVWDHVFFAAVLANEGLMAYLRGNQLPAYL